MKSKIKRKTLALVLAISMILMSLPISGIAVAGENNTAPFTNPFSQEVQFNVNGKTESSHSYRIPSMVTLADGTIVAAADIRWNTTFDGGGLDTLVARSTDGGANWSYTVANYLGDNGNVYNGSHSTAFLDPSLLVAADGKTVYMLVDLYAYGVALNGDSSHIQPVADTGFDANGNLKLSNNEHYSYDYYLKDGKIYNSLNKVEEGYTVDPYFNITYTLAGEIKKSNLFFADSPFKVARTQYLYLTKSTDGGATWSEPNLLDVRAKAKVAATENALLVSPGNSITTSDGFMVYPTYSFIDSDHQALALIYSVDGVHWERSTDYTALKWSSEGSIVELQNGNLRVFVRNRTGYLCYVDFDMNTKSWIGHTQTTVPTNSNTQLSAITYSKTFNGQQVILVSCPTGPNEAGSNNNDGSCRTNGKIFMGVVAADRTMSWPKSIDVGPAKATSQLSGFPYTEEQGFFAYSCLTERSDGSVAILYENNQFSWGASGSNGDGTYDSEKVTTYYTITGKSFTADELGVYPDLDEMTKVMLKEGVTQVTLYQNPADSSAGSVSVTADELDGVYLVDSWYIDETTGEKWYLLKDSASHSWPEEQVEYRYVSASVLEETDQGLSAPIIDFTNAAPIFEAPAVTPYAARRSMFASPAQTFAISRAIPGPNDPLKLSKVVEDLGNGKAKITLEAFTTGTVTVTNSTKPMDIVLVIDQSGSMAYCIECGKESVVTSDSTHPVYTYTATYTIQNNNTYYVQVGSEYQQVTRYYNTWYRYDGHNWIKCAPPKTSESDTNASHVQFYTRTQSGTESCTRRYDALITALNTFVTAVKDKSVDTEGNPVNHRIAIVGFSSSGYNNTELLTGVTLTTNNNTNLNNNGTKYYPDNQQHNGVQSGNITNAQYQAALQDMSTKNGQDNVSAAIGALTAHGGTQTLDGMTMAENILKNKTLQNEDRNEVVILFTDGVTNSDRGDLLNKAHDIKSEQGATVYSIGIFDGANGNLDSYDEDIDDNNSLMHLISSNYPDAQYTNTYYGESLNAGELNDLVEDGSKSFYLSASNATALNNIFESLSSQIGATPMPLDSNTVVKDIVTPQFTLPANATAVTVKQVACLTYNSSTGAATWDDANAVTLSSSTVKINEENHSVDVSGFDFAHNYVAEIGRDENDDKKEGSFKGRKLVIVFTIEPDPDFLGGDHVATNSTDSGIYKKNEDGTYTCVGNFEPGYVDVPLKEISNAAQDKHIYLGNTTNLIGILNLHVAESQSGKDLQSIANGINNAYVDLVYTVTVNGGTVYTYTIEAGEKWDQGEWKQGDTVVDLSAVSVTEDTDYSVTCVMTSENKDFNQKSTNASANIFVYKPTVTFKDSVQNYKKPLNNGAAYENVNAFLDTHKVGVVWKHETQTAMPEGDVPEISFVYTYADGAFNGFVMNSVHDVPVNVTATIQGTGTAIGNNEGVTYKHQNCGGGVNCKYGMGYEEFIVHVINALTSLTIEKTGAADIDVNQSFLFTVTGKDADGKDINLTVTVHGNGSTIIDGLVIGNEYTITEKTDWSWRYRFSKWEHRVNADDATTTTTGSTNGAAIKLGENGTITFTNERKEVKWLDGDSWCNNIFNRIIKMFK